jgi:hypothetical protein
LPRAMAGTRAGRPRRIHFRLLPGRRPCPAFPRSPKKQTRSRSREREAEYVSSHERAQLAPFAPEGLVPERGRAHARPSLSAADLDTRQCGEFEVPARRAARSDRNFEFKATLESELPVLL